MGGFLVLPDNNYLIPLGNYKRIVKILLSQMLHRLKSKNICPTGNLSLSSTATGHSQAEPDCKLPLKKISLIIESRHFLDHTPQNSQNNKFPKPTNLGIGNSQSKFKIKTKKTRGSSRKIPDCEPLKPPKTWRVRTIAFKSNLKAFAEDLPRQPLTRACSLPLEPDEMSLIENEYWSYCMDQNDFENLEPKMLPESHNSDLSCILDGFSKIHGQ
jgi:hypothetical protein